MNENKWKLTAIGMGIMIITALVTGIVVANWPGRGTDVRVEFPAPTTPAAVRRAETESSPAASPRIEPRSVPTSRAIPPQAAVDVCNRSAAAQAESRDTKEKVIEVVKDAIIGGAVGAGVGAAGGAIADGGSGAGKGAALGGVVGAAGGTLYGLNDNHKNDQRYREAYAACMRSRGHVS